MLGPRGFGRFARRLEFPKMLPHLDRKLFRDLNRLKGQVAAVSIVMACGLAMMITTRSLIASLDGSRAGGYRVDLFGSGYVAEKVGLLPELRAVFSPLRDSVVVQPVETRAA